MLQQKQKIVLKVQVLLPKMVALLKGHSVKPPLCFVEREKNFFYEIHAAIPRTDELPSLSFTTIDPAKSHVMSEEFTKQTPCCKSCT